MLLNASISECIRLFPPYFAGAVEREAGPGHTVNAAMSMTRPHRGWTGYTIMVEVISAKIDHICSRAAWGPFGGSRWISLPRSFRGSHGYTRSAPDPRPPGCTFAAKPSLLASSPRTSISEVVWSLPSTKLCCSPAWSTVKCSIVMVAGGAGADFSPNTVPLE